MEDDEIEIEQRTFKVCIKNRTRAIYNQHSLKRNKKQFVKSELDFSVLVLDPSKENIENVRYIFDVWINR